MLDVTQKIVIVTRKTQLEELEQRFTTRSHAKFYLTRARENFAASKVAQSTKSTSRTPASRAAASPDEDAFAEASRQHAAYQAAIDRLRRDLDLGLKVMFIGREYLPTFVFGPNDIVVTLGQDGLVANTAKYTLGRPVVAVNPDPQSIDGILLPFHVSQARQAVRNVLDGKSAYRRVTLGQVQTNDGQTMLAFNDFLVGARSHTSARYRVEVNGKSEQQSSSGIIISTGAGSTGWLSSIFNMLQGVMRQAGGVGAASVRMQWEDPRLTFVVREPFVSKASQAGIVMGFLDAGHEMVVESRMAQEGVIFSDGIEQDFLRFTSGMIARISPAPTQAMLAVTR